MCVFKVRKYHAKKLLIFFNVESILFSINNYTSNNFDEFYFSAKIEYIKLLLFHGKQSIQIF